MYSTLDIVRKEIRLLQLYPGAWADEVRCRLLPAFLLDDPDYKALSYVWGDPLDSTSITVNNVSTIIGRNLFEAFQRIRDEESTIVIWVDALCINQADLDERSQQVQLMKDIYSSANEVLVWLGYGTSVEAPRTRPRTYHWTNSEADLTIVNHHFNDDGISRGAPDTIPGLQEFVYLSLLVSGKHLPEISEFYASKETGWSDAMTAIADLLDAPWWSRVWVLQEVVLARKVTVIYGTSEAPWDIFAGVGNSLWRHRSSCCLEFSQSLSHKDGLLLERLGGISDEFLYITGNRERNNLLTLRDLLEYSIWRSTTDPRDKVYGILGLVTNWYGEEPLLPDYNQELADVLMHITLQDIRGSQKLEALLGVPSELPRMPSWVTQGSNSIRWRVAQGNRRFHMRIYSAAGTTNANAVQEGRNLIISGFEPIDTVAQVGSILFHGSDSYDSSIALINAWQLMCNELRGYDEGTFWQVVFGDLMKPYDTDTSIQRIKPVASIFAAIQEDWWTWFQSESSTGSQDGAGFSTEDRYRINRIHQAFINANALRCFFTTTGGRAGTGPPGLQPGDQIVILLGGTAPFCIRRHEGEDNGINAALVGDVYLHGLMDGEGIPENWEAKVVQIRLGDDIPATPIGSTRGDDLHFPSQKLDDCRL